MPNVVILGPDSFTPVTITHPGGSAGAKNVLCKNMKMTSLIARSSSSTPSITECTNNASPMQKPFMRIPYTGPLPPPIITPRSANTPTGAISALTNFLTAPPSSHLKAASQYDEGQTVLLTGAGISVASGLADYRGTNGTYTLNRTYRPIYFNEFISNHEARKRYWARSFLGWTNLHKARPNSAHWAVKRLGEMGWLRSVITQSACIA